MEKLIRKFLEDHVLFKDYANPDFITSLVVAMKPRIYVDGAHIIKKVFGFGNLGRNRKSDVFYSKRYGRCGVRRWGNGFQCDD